MKTLLVFILGIVAIIIFLFVALVISQKDIPDLLGAQKIPKYPNVTSWTISSGCGIPGEGSCGADINFSTIDSKDKVVSFYKSELPKQGIEYYTNIGALGNKSPDTEERGWMNFKKGSTIYYFSYSKTSDNSLECRFHIAKAK